ncbi:MAG: ABC transporter ATP-binding protein [bacterium]
MQFLQRLRYLYNPHKKQIAIICTYRLLFEFSKLIVPFLFGQTIDILTSHREDFSKLIWIIVIYFFAENFSSLIAVARSKSEHHFLTRLITRIRSDAHKKLLELPISYHESSNTHKKMEVIGMGIDRFTNFTVNIIFEFMPTILLTSLTFVMVFFMNWQMSFTYVVFVPVFLVVTWYMNQQVRETRVAIREGYLERSRKMGESIGNVKTVQDYVQEHREVGKIATISEGILKHEDHREDLLRSFNFFRDLIINCARTATIILGAYLTFNNSITIGLLSTFWAYSEKVYANLFRLSRFYDVTADCIPSVEQLTEIFEEKSSIVDSISPTKLEKYTGEIEFANVSFSYPSQKQQKGALHNISFHIKPQEIVAFVGPSGSGKSTIIKLLYRHFDPQDGEIKLDNVNITQLQRAQFRTKMSIVSQDIDVFDETILENIKYGDPEATEESVIEAAKSAYLHDFIIGLSDGYNTMIGERGVRLSGGQKQRLGIARALLTKPSILVLDEATSSLDSESELYIQKAIDNISRQCTILIIAHRFSTIRRADKIIVLDHGKIIEEGDHNILHNKSGGLYAKLYQLQHDGVLN